MCSRCSPYTYTSELALNSNLAEMCSEQILYLCSIAQSCLDHLPRGGDEGSTQALHRKQESNCKTDTSRFRRIFISSVGFRIYFTDVRDRFNFCCKGQKFCWSLSYKVCMTFLHLAFPSHRVKFHVPQMSAMVMSCFSLSLDTRIGSQHFRTCT